MGRSQSYPSYESPYTVLYKYDSETKQIDYTNKLGLLKGSNPCWDKATILSRVIPGFEPWT